MLTLPVWLSLVTVAASGLMGIAYGKRLHRRGVTFARRVRVREMALIPVGLILFVALVVVTQTLLSYRQWGWYVPAPVEYYLLPAAWMLKLVLVTFSMAAIAHLAFLLKHRARVLFGVGAVVVVAAVEGLMRVASLPYLPELSERVANGVVLQTSACTCAAATCANIAGRFGIAKTEAEMAGILHTTWSGTSPAQIIYAMRALGLDARKAASVRRDPADIRAPAVLLVDFGCEADGHAVAYMGMKGDVAEIWDPLSGVTVEDKALLAERWRGHAIEVFERAR